MKLSQFNFKLPEAQVALYPHKTKRIVKTSTGEERTFEVTRRDEARMMVLHKKSETIDMYRKDANGNPIEGEFIEFKDIVNYFDEGDTFVFNNTKVFPARLYGTKEKTDAKIEVFLLRELNEEMRLWDVLVEPARKIRIGNKLFFDPFVSVGGYLKDINFNSEVQMNGLAIGKEYILAPHFSSFIAKYIKESNPEVEDKDILSIMVKVEDDMVGTVDEDGNVFKFNTIDDIRRLAQGCAAAGSILEKVGVDATTMTSTIFRGAHPGGTAAIGDVVDNNLKTEIDGLYVGDASVIPMSPGKPPILLILALALRLANHLIEEVI